MKLEEYIFVDGKKMRCGYTTGSCALATTKAALEALKNRETIEYVGIETPAGIDLFLEVKELYRDDRKASYSIYKDGGDDPDITDGLEIISTVTIENTGEIRLDGGIGVGRIKKKGLFGEVGDPAINPVPKKMLLDCLIEYNKTGLSCIIDVPRGEEAAKKTFNPYMGIEGGISILGTKGIVYPMSKDAYIKSMFIEMDLKKEEGHKEIILTPGNYGMQIAQDMNLDLPLVKVSNYLGDTLRYAESLGFQRIVLIGHIGKFSKLSIGIFNTHSASADTRMEAFVYYLALMRADYQLISEVNNCISAEEALKICQSKGYGNIIENMQLGCQERVSKYIKNSQIKIDVIIYSMNKEGKK